jgi:hypothetical protein
MSGSEWRSVRVYVSSDFSDCVGERRHLEAVVRRVVAAVDATRRRGRSC